MGRGPGAGRSGPPPDLPEAAWRGPFCGDQRSPLFSRVTDAWRRGAESGRATVRAPPGLDRATLTASLRRERPGDHAPTQAVRARTETRHSPVDDASETDAGPASSFWGFYFFKIIHTNGYSHKHDLTKILLAYHISRTAPAQAGQRPHPHDRRRRPDLPLAPAGRRARPPSLGTRGSCQNRERQPWFCFSKLF